jgi:hypothetical protein
LRNIALTKRIRKSVFAVLAGLLSFTPRRFIRRAREFLLRKCAKVRRFLHKIALLNLVQRLSSRVKKNFYSLFLFTPFYFFQGGFIMIENSLVYATIVFGVVGAMLTVVLVAVDKVLKHEGTRPEDNHS